MQIARICAFGLKDIVWPGFSAFGKIQLHSHVRLNNILYRDGVHDPFVCISYNNIYICKHSYIYIILVCSYMNDIYIIMPGVMILIYYIICIIPFPAYRVPGPVMLMQHREEKAR